MPFIFFLSSGNFTPPAPLTELNQNQYQFLRSLQLPGTNLNVVGKELQFFGNATIAAGQFARALSFDGTAGTYALLANNSDYNLGSNDWSQSLWIKPNTLTGTQTLVDRYDTTVAYSWQINLVGNTINVKVRNAAANGELINLTSTTVVNTTGWHHVLIQRRVNTLVLYVNGIDNGSTPISGATLDSSLPINIARQVSGGESNRYNGLIEDIIVYKGSALIGANSPAVPFGVPTIETTPPKDYDPNLNNVVFQLTGQHIYNYYGSLATGNLGDLLSKSLTVAGAISLDNSIVKFTGNRTLLFNNTNQQISLATSADFGFGTGNFIVESQVRFSSLAGTQDILRIGNIRIYQTANTIRFNDGAADRITSGTLSTATWYHVVLQRTSGTSRLYINGASAGTYADSNNYGSTNTVLISNSTTNAFAGNIDQIRVFKAESVYPSTGFTPPLVALNNPQKNPVGTDRSRTVIWLDADDYEVIGDATQDKLGNPLSVINGVLLSDFSSPYNAKAFQGSTAPTTLDPVMNFTCPFNIKANDWTVEFWAYKNTTNNVFNALCGQWSQASGASQASFILRYETNGNIALVHHQNVGQDLFLITAPKPSDLQWHHIALSRSGTTYRLFVDGISVGSATGVFNDAFNPSLPMQVLGYTNNIATFGFDGFISNFKFQLGAKYVANFSIFPDNALETDHYSTDLLITADNTYGSTFNWDRTGKTLINTNTSVVTDNAFFNGRAISFNGTSSVISVTNKPTNYSGDFSIEFEMSPTNLTGSKNIIEGDNYLLRLNGSTLQFESPISTSLISATVTSGRKRVFLGRRNGQLQLAVDNTFVAPVTSSVTLQHQTTLNTGTTSFDGKLSSIRMKNKYLEPSRNQAPPIASDPYINNVVTLIPGIGVNGGTSFPELTGLAVTGNGGITTSTAQSRFNGSSIIHDGTDDNLSIPNGSYFNFGSGSLTLEGWWRFTNLSGSPQNYLYSFGTQWSLYVTSTGSVVLFDGSSIAATATGIITTGSWFHIRAVKNTSNAYLFVDGIQSATGTWATATTPTGALTIGGLAASGFVNGHSQWHRITNVARSIESFPVPTQPFPLR